MRVEQLSLCSQGLLLPLGVVPTLAPTCRMFGHSHDSEIWWVLATIDLGNVIQGQGVPDPAVRRGETQLR